jgi:hypothetical protein
LTQAHPNVHLFGIRHHGPGSARSLVTALGALEPDCILIEGPPEAQALLPMVLHDEMQPPVALLVYAPNDPARAVFYPFAVFSPEWQALRYGLTRSLPTRFFDLPVAHRFAETREAPRDDVHPPGLEPDQEIPPAEAPTDAVVDAVALDPLSWLARAAGYEDGERWWEVMVEERQDGTQVLDAIHEAMTALREELHEELAERHDPWEARREAHMRMMIREALVQGHERIAVVCGAWHTPGLADLTTAEGDAELLVDLPSVSATATWAPWTFARLARSSGYGAGITSPGWYHHLWMTEEGVSTRWLAGVAALLREQDLDASSAQVIDAVRLADTLAAMRGRTLPGLDELNEAAYALFAHGNDLTMHLIRERLIISDRLGQVPADTPAAPLQQDLAQEQKRLRMKPDAAVKTLELDLRKDLDLERSQLLHRLNLLGVTWGRELYTRSKGTFKEGWELRWVPEFAVTLIEGSRYGQTVEGAATGQVLEILQEGQPLPKLTELLDRVLLAALPQATVCLMRQLEVQATQDTDLTHLMDALPPLARVTRYGNVRQTDTDMVRKVVDGLLIRITVGLPNACAALSDDAAQAMYTHLIGVHEAVMLLQDSEQTTLWQGALERLTRQGNLHGLIAGRCLRLLQDMNVLTPHEVAERFGLALSDPEPDKAGAWVEGFLRGSGLVLVHDDALFGVLDSWLASLTPDAFVRLLPLLRRTFSTFEAPERRALGERAARGETRVSVRHDTSLNPARGEKVLPLAAQLLGLSTANASRDKGPHEG